MGKLAEAYVDIGANTKGLDTGLARARASLGSFMGFAGKAIGGVGLAGIGGAGAGLLATAKKAANLAESMSKVENTFGAAATAVKGSTDELAKKFGVVRQDALDAAAAFGLMGQAAGLSKDKSAGLANEMVQLGLDLASFHNLSNAEAFEKLRSGLSGEAEPLRPLGILLSDDAMKAQALAMGLIKVKRELTEQEKVLARVALIKKQAGPAVGDLARTADSTSNQMKKLQGELENAATAFGEGLQGALSDAIKLAHELGDAIKKSTGKSVAENVGESTRAVINAGRADLAFTPEDQANRRKLQHLNAGVAIDKWAGLDVSQERMDELNKFKRLEEERVAKVAGLNLSSPATRTDQGRKLPRDLAEAHAAGVADVMAARKFHADRHAANEEQARKFREDAKLKKERAAIRDARPGLFGRLAAGAATGLLGTQQAGLFGALAKFGGNQGGGPGGVLARAAGAFGGNLAKAAGRDKTPFQSQQFGSQSEFASFAVSKALSDDDELPKQQLEALKAANDKLDAVKENGANLLAALANRPILGAILRGAQ